MFAAGFGIGNQLISGYGIYNKGAQGTSGTIASGGFFLTPHAVKDAVLQLSSKNIPRLGETYVCFIHPSQSRQLRDTPEFIEVSKYAAPGNFMLGEIGRLYDVVFIETTQVGRPLTTTGTYEMTYDDGQFVTLRKGDTLVCRNTMHGWRNTSGKMCLLFEVLCDARGGQGLLPPNTGADPQDTRGG